MGVKEVRRRGSGWPGCSTAAWPASWLWGRCPKVRAGGQWGAKPVQRSCTGNRVQLREGASRPGGCCPVSCSKGEAGNQTVFFASLHTHRHSRAHTHIFLRSRHPAAMNAVARPSQNREMWEPPCAQPCSLLCSGHRRAGRPALPGGGEDKTRESKCQHSPRGCSASARRAGTGVAVPEPARSMPKPGRRERGSWCPPRSQSHHRGTWPGI